MSFSVILIKGKIVNNQKGSVTIAPPSHSLLTHPPKRVSKCTARAMNERSRPGDVLRIPTFPSLEKRRGEHSESRKYGARGPSFRITVTFCYNNLVFLNAGKASTL